MEKLILHYIDETMKAVNISKTVTHLSNKINMTYNYITDEISFDAKRITKVMKNYPHISLKDYVITFTLHELGHALDRENLLKSYDQTVHLYKLRRTLNQEEQKTNIHYLELSFLEDRSDLNFEHVAWSNAINLNIKHNLVSPLILQELKQDSLITYKTNLEQSKSLFDLNSKEAIAQ